MNPIRFVKLMLAPFLIVWCILAISCGGFETVESSEIATTTLALSSASSSGDTYVFEINLSEQYRARKSSLKFKLEFGDGTVRDDLTIQDGDKLSLDHIYSSSGSFQPKIYIYDTATNNLLEEQSLTAVSVALDTNAVSSIRITPSSSGQGTSPTTDDVCLGYNKTYYAAAYNAGGTYLGNVSVTWILSNLGGGISASSGTTTTFSYLTASSSTTGTLQAVYGTGTSQKTASLPITLHSSAPVSLQWVQGESQSGHLAEDALLTLKAKALDYCGNGVSTSLTFSIASKPAGDSDSFGVDQSYALIVDSTGASLNYRSFTFGATAGDRILKVEVTNDSSLYLTTTFTAARRVCTITPSSTEKDIELACDLDTYTYDVIIDGLGGSMIDAPARVSSESTLNVYALTLRNGGVLSPTNNPGSIKFQITTNLEIDGNSRIRAIGMGYPGGSSETGYVGLCPVYGYTTERGCGGSHGGLGGKCGPDFNTLSESPRTYDFFTRGTAHAGCGGGGDNGGGKNGGNGGGVINLVVMGNTTINGQITAEGGDGEGGGDTGGGAGGYISLRSIGGISGSGSINAAGGGYNRNSSAVVGGGGGGRIIAVSGGTISSTLEMIANGSSQSDVSPSPIGMAGGAGTAYLKENSAVEEVATTYSGGNLVINEYNNEGSTEIGYDAWTVAYDGTEACEGSSSVYNAGTNRTRICYTSYLSDTKKAVDTTSGILKYFFNNGDMTTWYTVVGGGYSEITSENYDGDGHITSTAYSSPYMYIEVEGNQTAEFPVGQYLSFAFHKDFDGSNYLIQNLTIKNHDGDFANTPCGSLNGTSYVGCIIWHSPTWVGNNMTLAENETIENEPPPANSGSLLTGPWSISSGDSERLYFVVGGNLSICTNCGIFQNYTGYPRGYWNTSADTQVSAYLPSNTSSKSFAANANGAVKYSGGSHGGVGGTLPAQRPTSSPNVVYGSYNQPIFPGSGGGGGVDTDSARKGGHGGGSMYLAVVGTVTLNGVIRANGENSGTTVSGIGGGAGGSIWLTASSITWGTGASITANGGAGGIDTANGNILSGAGGGGRIAVYYGSGSFETSRITVYGGTAYNESDAEVAYLRGGPGTIYYEQVGTSKTLYVKANSGFTQWFSPMGNEETYFMLPETINDSSLNLVIDGNGSNTPVNFDYPNYSINNLTLVNRGRLKGQRNFVLSASGNIELWGTSIIEVSSNRNDVIGNINLIAAGHIKLAEASTIFAKGFLGARSGANATNIGMTVDSSNSALPTTSGGSSGGCGGSYAGYGGSCTDGSAGKVYNAYNNPHVAGSGGGTTDPVYVGGNGGGYVYLQADQIILQEAAAIWATGGNGTCYSGGGSGGAIKIELSGSNKTVSISDDSTLNAFGGDITDTSLGCTSGAGGGGRILVNQANSFTGMYGNLKVHGGKNWNTSLSADRSGGGGTVSFQPGGFLIIQQNASSPFIGGKTPLVISGTVSSISYNPGTNKTAVVLNDLNYKLINNDTAVGAMDALVSLNDMTMRKYFIESVDYATQTIIVTGDMTGIAKTGSRVAVTTGGWYNSAGAEIGRGLAFLEIDYGAIAEIDGLVAIAGSLNLKCTNCDSAVYSQITSRQGYKVLIDLASGAAGLSMQKISLFNGSKIDVTGKGGQGGTESSNPGQSGLVFYGTYSDFTADTTSNSAGGSHAAFGGSENGLAGPNIKYGGFKQPFIHGSGGAAQWAGSAAGSGGGVVWVTARTIEMWESTSIIADGQDAISGSSGGGSGGSIWLNFTGEADGGFNTSTAGTVISARGGWVTTSGATVGGGGSGGRISINNYMNTSTILETLENGFGSGLRADVSGGVSLWYTGARAPSYYHGGHGTLFLQSANSGSNHSLPGTLLVSGDTVRGSDSAISSMNQTHIGFGCTWASSGVFNGTAATIGYVSDFYMHPGELTGRGILPYARLTGANEIWLTAAINSSASPSSVFMTGGAISAWQTQLGNATSQINANEGFMVQLGSDTGSGAYLKNILLRGARGTICNVLEMSGHLKILHGDANASMTVDLSTPDALNRNNVHLIDIVVGGNIIMSGLTEIRAIGSGYWGGDKPNAANYYRPTTGGAGLDDSFVPQGGAHKGRGGGNPLVGPIYTYWAVGGGGGYNNDGNQYQVAGGGFISLQANGYLCLMDPNVSQVNASGLNESPANAGGGAGGYLDLNFLLGFRSGLNCISPILNCGALSGPVFQVPGAAGSNGGHGGGGGFLRVQTEQPALDANCVNVNGGNGTISGETGLFVYNP